MTTVKDIINIIESAAPLCLAEEWDNPGLMVGRESAPVHRVLTALDCDMEVVKEAVEKGCDMIVTHHPLIFRPLSFVTSENSIGRILLALAENKIALYSAHTNFDGAKGGINDFLCDMLNLQNVEICESIGGGNLVRKGKISPTPFSEYAAFLAKTFNKPYIRCVGDKNKMIERVAICSGGGGDFVGDMAELCDLFITGDVKYHAAREAHEQRLCLAMVEHFETEHFTAELFRSLLEKEGVDALVSQANKDVVYDIKI